MNITVRSKLHDTDAYKSKCTSMTCEVHLDFLGSNVLLLTTKTFQVKISYVNIFCDSFSINCFAALPLFVMNDLISVVVTSRSDYILDVVIPTI